MKVRDLINLVRKEIYNGVTNNNTNLNNISLYYVINNARNFLLVDKLNKKQPINYSFYTKIEVPLELTEINGCKVLKSKCKIPKIVSSLYGDKIMSVTTKEIAISRIKYQDLPYIKYSRRKSNRPKYFILDNYLYIVKNINFKNVTLNAVFEDMYEVGEYKKECGFTNCNDFFDEEYPSNTNSINRMIDYIKSNVFKRKPDLVNNQIDE